MKIDLKEVAKTLRDAKDRSSIWATFGISDERKDELIESIADPDVYNQFLKGDNYTDSYARIMEYVCENAKTQEEATYTLIALIRLYSDMCKM